MTVSDSLVPTATAVLTHVVKSIVDAPDAVVLTNPQGAVQFDHVSFRYKPDVALIGRLMRWYVYVVASQGALQVAIIVVMARFVTGL